MGVSELRWFRVYEDGERGYRSAAVVGHFRRFKNEKWPVIIDLPRLLIRRHETRYEFQIFVREDLLDE